MPSGDLPSYVRYKDITTPVGDEFVYLDSPSDDVPRRISVNNLGSSSFGTLDGRIVVNQSNVATTLGGTIDSTKQYFIDGSIDMSGVTVTVPSTGIFIKGYNLDLSELTCADNNYVMFDGATAGNVFFQDLS